MTQAGLFALIAALVYAIDLLTVPDLTVAIAPYEVSGAALSLLLVLRTNSGYDRWWEARKLWGGIVNQSRNLAAVALAYGPEDPAWRAKFIRWLAAFAHACRMTLRGEKQTAELCALLGPEAAAEVTGSGHAALHVAGALARLLREAADRGGMDRFALLRAETECAALVDHLGGCERILKTPIPRIYTVAIHQFIAVYLIALPFALIPHVGWLTPLVALFVAFPIVALDQIGKELQNPFSVRSLNHLPLDEICRAIEQNVFDLLIPHATRNETFPTWKATAAMPP